MNRRSVTIQDHHNKSISEIPEEIKNSAVQALKTVLSDMVISEIQKAHENDPVTWWAAEHFSWGMGVRNFLRDNVCLDDKLPSGNWDDYYIPIVEIVCGLRK
jgi:hypothetical protein